MAAAAVLVAAGSGQRLGAELPKAFVTVAGRNLLEHALSRFASCEGIDSIVVAAPVTHLQQADGPGRVVVPGGATRQQSVAAGLAALDDTVEYVLVHDVARPFVPLSVIDSVLQALRAGAAAVIPVVPVHDTVRRVGPAGELAGMVDRSSLVAVQTPQGFRRATLVEAHRRGAELEATDDAALVEAMGEDVVAVPGSDESFKITTPADLARAESTVPAGMHR